MKTIQFWLSTHLVIWVNWSLSAGFNAELECQNRQQNKDKIVKDNDRHQDCYVG